MFIAFEKWHGCLNDFLVVWVADQDSDMVLGSIKRQAVRLCDRRAGIGADGILVLRTTSRDMITPDRLVIINSDGSVAQNCGNGLRCAALSFMKRHREQTESRSYKEPLEALDLNVEGRTLTCRFLPGSHGAGGYPLVAVEMGVPRLDNDTTWYGEAKLELQRVAQELKRPDILKDWTACDIGNPHIVITLDHARRQDALTIGPSLQVSPTAKSWDGINVHVVEAVTISGKDRDRAGKELGQPVGELFKAFVWERGAGETQACGTGACAVAAAAVKTGLVERSEWLGIDMPGGRLYVKYEQDEEPIILAGPAAFVYAGKVEI